MKRLLAAACVLLVGFVLGAAFLGTVLHVGAVSVPRATQNGDTNGDGERDISDAVYLLQFLFSGGGDIAEIECPAPAPRATLVATNQTRCVGEAGFIDCSIAKARGQDAFYKKGCPFEGRFTDSGDGTITDTCTGLVWTKDYVDADGDGEIVQANDAMLWLDACQFAEDMTYLGHDDWRVPNLHELLSVMNFGEHPGQSQARPYAVFRFDGSWSSSHGHGPFSVGLTENRSFGCDCCLVRQLGLGEILRFAAVRGPVSQ